MTSVALSEPTPFSGNPIDLVEEIVNANDWAHDRASDEELVVENAVFEQLGVFPDDRRRMVAKRDHVRGLAGM